MLRMELVERGSRPERCEFDWRGKRFAGVDAIMLGLELEHLADDVFSVGRRRWDAVSASHGFTTRK